MKYKIILNYISLLSLHNFQFCLVQLNSFVIFELQPARINPNIKEAMT